MKEICTILYEDYYVLDEFTNKASSHWKKYGKYQKIKKIGKKYEAQGIGFGDFKNKSLLNNLFNLPTKIYIKNLLKNCDKEIIEASKYVANKSSRVVSYDLIRQSLTIQILKKNLEKLDRKTFCIIGDGYGSLGSILKKVYPLSKIIFINLGRTLFFDAYYTQKVFPNNNHILLREKSDFFSDDFNYIEAEKFQNLNINADIFINICSMQEMNYKDIFSYFEMIRKQNKDTWFYCCNRISKSLPDGSIINFKDYPWSPNDFRLFDELCPWHQKYPKNKPPFVAKFDGPINHCLIKMDLHNATA